MSDRRLLYFTAAAHQVYLWRAGRLEHEATYAPDDAGVAAFSDFAKLHPKSLYYVLADLAGEDFHDEMIPWLRGGDRQAVIERRLAQRYRDTRLAATISLGQVSIAGERRNERLLLASFTNTQQFSPWLDALSGAGAKLAGVYSVPLLAPALASRISSKIGLKSGSLFVVSLNSAGLRQSYLEGGRLRFARLERTVEMGPEALAAFVRSETLRLMQYLSSLRVLPRDGPSITALVIAPPGQKAVFERSLPSDARLTFRTLDLAEAAGFAGIKSAERIGAEQLYLHLAAKSAPKDQFARSEDRRGYLFWQLQRGVVAAGAIGLAGCLAFAGYKWLDVMRVRDQTEVQQREARNADQEYQRITATFPVTQTTTENLKVTVNEFRALAARSAAPGPSFAHLSKALEQFPQIELDQLVWKVDRPSPLDKKASAPTPASPVPAGQTPPAGGAIDFVQVLEITGHVSATQRSDYRAVTAQVQRFAEALLGQSYEVIKTQLPFDTTSEGTLSGDIGSADNGENPRFTITVARKVGQ
jgi:hypothetical protein